MKIGVALTWDGARWPVRALPAKARAFLAGKDVVGPNQKTMAKLMADDQVDEIRVCWVPCLKGGDDVLAEPFLTVDGKRIAFKAVQTKALGDICGAIYRLSYSSPEGANQASLGQRPR